MPPATFMQIDERRDHSIRIPRPDHSLEFRTPNACNGCHTKESPTWARDALAKWFPDSKPRAHFVDGLARDRKGSLDAPRALRAAIERRPISVRGEPLTLQSAAQVSVSPPTFALRVNWPDQIHFSYERYLMRSLRLAFGFDGSPIRLSLRKASGRRPRSRARRSRILAGTGPAPD